MRYTFDFGAVLDRAPELLWGSLGTVGLALAGMLLALVIGLLGVVARSSKSEITRAVAIVFVEVVRNTPFLVQIFFIYFALPLMGIRLNPTVTAIIALGINGGAYAIEIIRGGIESVSRGQIEAGFALGLHKADVFRLIVLKPALRAIYPSLTSQFIMLTLTTSVCTSIAAYELTSAAQRIESDTFRSFEVYFTVTAIYLVISSLMMGLFALISRHYFNYPTR
ncbi:MULTISPECIES: amino acid ABC transporter permease [unclassified Mesorhizobium]|uniref:amino acid ABC transporter permease n=1 Tax=unclassified Mesorhizobium TaxID=325217 RepID=UPI000F755541|nr:MULTISPECIES: amino acid ABC transporter permease [unclassified Mesorhizobium]AZO22488.1 amino acid ABC transporter permease [Mesorhizobium sp. M1E.F.Ca.ET.045.02.1.1]RUW34823.1 ABC transporter permease subunit [Mesorhizobium sp. M1E.F.Ca.ET.041.01.1.1]RUW83138.1 ABC transporter permease subunit [Mesorhizobium sp. M1E.F.Ca.ET.063.01.1.1]RWB59007.1 MAG: ABC transporter permease subunit [Mesorhizobium sp.]RWD88747.1 MAG: ABC transporter permease subunit [Mesorhizobium sp.]